MKSKPWLFSIILAITSVASFFMPWYKLIGSASFGGQSVSRSIQHSPSDFLIVYSPWLFFSAISAVLAILKSRSSFIPALLNFYPILSSLGLFGKGLGFSVASSGASVHAEHKLMYGYWVFAISTTLFIVAILIKNSGKEINGEFILKLFKRTLIAILVFCILVGIAIITFLYFGVSDNGVRTGRVISISEKGSTFKTIEGQLNINNFSSKNNANTISELFYFSVDNSKTDVIEGLKKAALDGHRINVHYIKRYATFPWRGETRYFVETIEQIDSPNPTESNESSQSQSRVDNKKSSTEGDLITDENFSKNDDFSEAEADRAAAADFENSMIVKSTDGLILRDKPEVSGNKITIVLFEERVIIIHDEYVPIAFQTSEKSGYWQKVNYKGQIGYMFDGFLEKQHKLDTEITAGNNSESNTDDANPFADDNLSLNQVDQLKKDFANMKGIEDYNVYENYDIKLNRNAPKIDLKRGVVKFRSIGRMYFEGSENVAMQSDNVKRERIDFHPNGEIYFINTYRRNIGWVDLNKHVIMKGEGLRSVKGYNEDIPSGMWDTPSMMNLNMSNQKLMDKYPGAYDQVVMLINFYWRTPEDRR